MDARIFWFILSPCLFGIYDLAQLDKQGFVGKLETCTRRIFGSEVLAVSIEELFYGAAKLVAAAAPSAMVTPVLVAMAPLSTMVCVVVLFCRMPTMLVVMFMGMAICGFLFGFEASVEPSHDQTKDQEEDRER